MKGEGPSPRGRAIRETLGFVAVVASLWFVAVETRQNTAAVESASLQSLAELRIEVDVAGWSDDSMWAVVGRLRSGATPEDFDEADTQRIRLWYFSHIRIVELAYRQELVGVVDPGTALKFKSGLFQFTYLREAWPTMRYNFEDEFVVYFEREFLEL